MMNGGYDSFTQVLISFFAYATIIFVMLPVHEYAHAFTAVKLGDPTPRGYGRLTLNPMAHLDLIGSLMIFLIGFGYAKPVPVNPHNFRSRRKGMALTAFAGPLSNLLMAILSVGLFRLYLLFSGGVFDPVNLRFDSERTIYVYMVLILIFARINVTLAVFNLLPIPPLDGSRIFSSILPYRWTAWIDRYFLVVQIALFALIFTGTLEKPISLMVNGIMAIFGFNIR